MKTILITGSSSGIGEACATYFANNGFRVIATARNVEKIKHLSNNGNITILPMDVCDIDSINNVTKYINDNIHSLDIILNNAGYGLLAPFECSSDEQIKNIFNTNVFGVMNVCKSFLPKLKAQKSGLIVNVTSIGGLVSMPLNSIYHSTKYAIEGFSEGLIYELKQFNIKVKIIEPGGVATNFNATAISQEFEHNDYNDIITKIKHAFSSRKDNYSTAQYVAEGIFKACGDESNKIRYIIGDGAKAMYNLKNTLSDYEYVEAVHKMFIGE